MDSAMTVDAPFKADATEQLRFESFKLGWADGAPGLPRSRPQSQRRSHSRSGSVSSSITSLSMPAPSSSQDFASLPSTSSLSSKRNSHHRRRSSVSTRHESAEIMGVQIPELPGISLAEEQGDKDSSRRHALWALEGKQEASVEIPSTPDMEKMMLSFPSKPSFPPGSAFGSAGLSSMISNKRDSFKLAPKDQLHTLVEEEEEEEETSTPHKTAAAPPPTPITPTSPVHVFQPTSSARSRLSLRPLSLTPESVGSLTHGLPTPGCTPKHSLKDLTLRPSPPMRYEEEQHFTNFNGNDNSLRQTLHKEPSPTPRRPPLELKILSSPSVMDDKPVSKRSSISYRRSSTGLPTPDMTPTYADWRHSTSGSTSSSAAGSISSIPDAPLSGVDDGDFFANGGSRRMSASEQHFLWKSHNALLARIQDLERTLVVSRRESLMSSVSSEAMDDVSRQVNDLTAERDELKRDVDGWRVRCGDLEKQIGMVARRIDEERKEAWVALERAVAVQAEKSFLERQLGEKEILVDNLKHIVEELEAKVAASQTERSFAAEDNVRLQQRNQDLEVELEIMRSKVVVDDHVSTPTATFFQPSVSAHSSVDALLDTPSSATDVDFDPFEEEHVQLDFAVSAAEEVSDDDYSQSTPEDESLTFDDGDENGLAGYEDEEEDDYVCQSPTESTGSFGSPQRPRAVEHLRTQAPQLPLPELPVFQPKHQVRGSLSKTWAWPKATAPMHVVEPAPTNDDKFFGCLDESSSDGSSPLASRFNFTDGKSLFCESLKAFGDEDNDPFYSTSSVDDGSNNLLRVVTEEDEDTEGEETQVGDEEDMFCGSGEIKITFTPADSSESVDLDTNMEIEVKSESQPNSTYFEDSDSEDDYGTTVPFTFGRKIAVQSPPSAIRSSIPRPVTIYRTPSSDSMASDASSSLSDSPIQASPRPSFIPQPSSPARRSSPSLMRQPPRKAGTFPKASEHTPHAGKANIAKHKADGSQMTSVDLSSPTITPILPQEAPSLFGAASRMSFQSLTNLISSPWTTTSRMTDVHSSPATIPPVTATKVVRYVPKNVQLEKLRQRLARENLHSPLFDSCGQCSHDAVVHL